MNKTVLEAKLKEKKEELKILYQITDTVSNNLDLDDVLKKIIQVVGQVTKADSCFLYLLEDNKLILRASKNPHKDVLGKVRLSLNKGITGWVAKNKKKIVLANKAWQDPRFEFIKDLPEDKYEAFFSLPIIYKEKLVGVINVQHRKAHKYNHGEKRLLEIIAQQVGGAIANAKLLNETIDLKEALEARKIVEKAKGLLMRESDISEEEAYKLLHKKSMDQRKSMRQIAEAVILYWDLKK